MHTPVLLNELINMLNIKSSGIYADCTGGGGGHAAAVLERLSDGGRLLITDRDPEAVERLKERFKSDDRVMIFRSNFSDIDQVFNEAGIDKADGIYADFGVSSFQLLDSARGFSFRNDGLIDMRMDNEKGISAIDVVNDFTAENIAVIIAKFGEEKFARRIASEIVKRRSLKKIATTGELAEAVKAAVPMKFRKKGIHPATKTFQALRIFVNGELEAIGELMRKIGRLLKTGGRFGGISFHSLEDRIVKDALSEYSKGCVCPPELPVCACGKHPEFRIITRKPLVPSEHEVSVNPLSRSAKLRIAEKL